MFNTIVHNSKATKYEAKQISVLTGASNEDVHATHATLFDTIKSARSITIYSTFAISIRFNANTEDAINIRASSEKTFSPENFGLAITNMFITNASGSTAVIDILIS